MTALLDLATALLRRFDPETAHDISLWAMKSGMMPSRAAADPAILATTLFNTPIPNPIGLAAGYDKNAVAVDGMFALGFGFVECGSITPRPQTGNARPRLFRLAEDEAVVNRMGFNNDGLQDTLARLTARRHRPGLVGVNIGANKDSADRTGDYVAGLAAVAPLAGYVTVNVSSPNTPGLRALQQRDELDRLLDALTATRASSGVHVPLALKIAPDLTEEDEADIAATVLAHGIDGLIVSNTTIVRGPHLRSPFAAETGGLSGRPLFRRSTALLARMRRRIGDQITLIGVGGVSTGAEAYAKIKAGAGAVQLYSALVYGGPGLVGRIKTELAALLRADGHPSVAAAVGTDLSPADWD